MRRKRSQTSFVMALIMVWKCSPGELTRMRPLDSAHHLTGLTGQQSQRDKEATIRTDQAEHAPKAYENFARHNKA